MARRRIRVEELLRDYQRDVYERWSASTVRRSLVVMPTAAGKTHVAVAAICDVLDRGGRVLACAHRRELIEQLVARLVAAGVEASRIGVRMGGARNRRDAAAPVQVVSVPSYRGDLGEFDLVVVDEAHRAAAKSYRKILDAHPGARVMGLTATPLRHDGAPLGALFEEIIESEPPAVLIAAGYIAAPRIFSAPELPDVRGVRRTGGDYEAKQLGERVDRPELWGSIVRDWMERASKLPTVVFAVNVRHAKNIARRFRAAGVRVEVVTGETPLDQRRAMEARVRDGRTRVLVNCEVLCEGWDVPSVRCVVLARPTLSLVLYLQQVGRCSRAGTTPIVLDHAGNARRFGAPHVYFDWSLKTKREEMRGGPAPFRRCECGAELPTSTRECPECGAELPAFVREEPIENGVPLVEIARRAGIDKTLFYARVRRFGIDRAIQMGSKLLKRQGLASAARAAGISAKVVHYRMSKGKSLEEAIAMGPAATYDSALVDAVRAAATSTEIPYRILRGRVSKGKSLEEAIAMGSGTAGAEWQQRIRDASARSGINERTLRTRTYRDGKTLEEAVAMGVRPPGSTSRGVPPGYGHMAAAAGITINGVYARMKKYGITFEEAIAMGPPKRGRYAKLRSV